MDQSPRSLSMLSAGEPAQAWRSEAEPNAETIRK
jgi:hypothetical protein